MAIPHEMLVSAAEEAKKTFPESVDKQEGFLNGYIAMYGRLEETINRMFNKEKKPCA